MRKLTRSQAEKIVAGPLRNVELACDCRRGREPASSRVSVLDRKLMREVRGSLLTLVAVGGIMSLGAMCFVYMRAAYHNLQTAKAAYYDSGRMADFWIDFKKAPLSTIDRLANTPGVSRLESRIQSFATVDLPNHLKPLNSLVISAPDVRTETLNDLVLASGEYFTSSRRNEVIVNARFAEAHQLRPGDLVHVLMNNRRQPLRIVGTAASCEFIYLLAPGAIAPDPAGFGVFYIKRTFAEEAFDMAGAANQVVGRLAGQLPDEGRGVLAELERALAPYGASTAIPLKDQISNQFISDEIRGLGTFSTILPAIFLTVGAVVLQMMMNRLIQQQRTVIGTLKALGYADATVLVHFLKYGAITGASAGLLGLVLGFFMSELITSVYRQFYSFPVLENAFYPAVYAGALAIAAAAGVVGCWQAAWQALRLRPAEAMRPAAPPPGKLGAIERFTSHWSGLSLAWRGALRNLLRSGRRSLTSAFASCVGAAILVVGLSLMAATIHLINFQFTQLLRSDIDLRFHDERPRAALLEARRIPGVDYAEPLFEVSCTFRHLGRKERGGITGLQRDARLTVPHDAHEQPLVVPAAGLLLSHTLADKLGVSYGDEIEILPTRGDRRPRVARIAGVADAFLGTAVYADFDYLCRLMDEEFAVTSVQLLTSQSPRAQEAFYQAVKRLPAVQATSSRRDAMRNLEETILKVQNIFIGLVTVFAGVIFFGAVLNASLVNVSERSREIGTLLVLGYTPGEVGGMLLRETMCVHLFGVVAGLPLGYGLVCLTSWAYSTDVIRLPVVVAPNVYITTLVVGVVFALAAHSFVHRRIARFDMVEAMRIRE